MLHSRFLKTICLLPLALVIVQGCSYKSEYIDSDTIAANTTGDPSNENPNLNQGLKPTITRCLGKKDTTLDSDRIVSNQEITLHRHSQTVIRKKKCDGSIISNKKEEILSPNKRIKIISDTLNKGDISVAKGYNRTTCDRTGALNSWANIFRWTWSGKAKLSFVVDQARTVFNTHVLVGDNYIDYEFIGSCPDSDPRCEDTERPILEKGTLILKVNYEVKDLDDEGKEPLVIEEECKP